MPNSCSFLCCSLEILDGNFCSSPLASPQALVAATAAYARSAFAAELQAAKDVAISERKRYKNIKDTSNQSWRGNTGMPLSNIDMNRHAYTQTKTWNLYAENLTTCEARQPEAMLLEQHVKVLLPGTCAGAIIGKHGNTLTEIRTSLGSQGMRIANTWPPLSRHLMRQGTGAQVEVQPAVENLEP